MVNRPFSLQRTFVAAFYLSAATLFLAPLNLKAQSKGTISQNPVNPLGLAISPNYTKPVRNAISAGVGGGREGETESVQTWTFTLSAAYGFLDERSKTGGISLDSQSGILDLTTSLNKFPWTCVDISYIYSHGSGSSPGGVSETLNQGVGSLRILQPLSFFGQCLPASRSDHSINDQLAVIIGADYAGSRSTVNLVPSAQSHSLARTFVGTFLLDYQRAWFPNRTEHETYPGWLFELSSGIQFNTIRLRSGDSETSDTSSSRQLTYQNIGCVTYSFSCGFGLLAAAEWDAPIYSDPLRGSKRFYSNTAVFTGGFVYNIYAYKDPDQRSRSWRDRSRWSASLLYSYVAFNPLEEDNQLIAQISYSF
jgi:hypothetical protein